MSCVTVKVPKAPAPFACMRRSGITSRSKWASFSRNHTSCSSAGPRGPAVIMLLSSTTGAPNAVVSLLLIVWPPLMVLGWRHRGSVVRETTIGGDDNWKKYILPQTLIGVFYELARSLTKAHR